MKQAVAALTLGVALALAGCAHQPPGSISAPTTDKAVAEPPALPVGSSWDGIVADATSIKAFRRLCPVLLKRKDPSGVTRPEDWQAPCADSDADPARFFQTHFAPVRLGSGAGFTTGYFFPEIQGLRASAPGALPVLARPSELIDVDLGLFSTELKGRQIRGVVRGNRLVRAPDRAAIENGAFAGRGLELAWVKNPIDFFFLQIQGSGQLRFSDGEVLRIGYAGQNGHAYVPVGRLLKERGALEKVGMAEIKAWMQSQPDRGKSLMHENPSYIFFRPLSPDLDGPPGALGIPLLAEAHVAADPSAMPLGAPVWLETIVDGKPWKRLLVAADTGGAIKGANRFDIFFGAGEQAAQRAGALQAAATATILLPKAAAQRLQ